MHLAVAKQLHLRREKCVPLLLLAKGLERYYQHVRRSTSDLDLKLGDGLGHTTIETLRTELSDWVPRVPFTRMLRIRLMFLDNWDMYAAVSNSHRKGNEVVKSTMLHAILLAEEYMDESIFSGPAPTDSLWVHPDYQHGMS